MANVIVSYTAVKQETHLTRCTVSLLIKYSREKVAECLARGLDVNVRIPWVYEVARMDKTPREIEGITCVHCGHFIRLRERYYRKRSNHYTRIYCIGCAERLGLRQ